MVVFEFCRISIHSSDVISDHSPDAYGNVISTGSVTWTDDANVNNAQTLLIGGRYGTDGNIYGSTTSSLWQGTVNDFKIYERVLSDTEIIAYLS